MASDAFDALRDASFALASLYALVGTVAGVGFVRLIAASSFWTRQKALHALTVAIALCASKSMETVHFSQLPCMQWHVYVLRC